MLPSQFKAYLLNIFLILEFLKLGRELTINSMTDEVHDDFIMILEEFLNLFSYIYIKKLKNAMLRITYWPTFAYLFLPMC